jgi:hypothetical protein
MQKTISYCSFLIFSTILIAVFLTTKTYTELAIAVILYPAAVIFAFRIFPKNVKESIQSTAPIMPVAQIPQQQNIQTQTILSDTNLNSGKTDVADIEKRAFLKLIGAAGLSLFIFSIFNRKVSKVPLLGKIAGPDTTAIEDVEGNKIDPAQTQPTDGYKISEIDDNIITYYGFIKKGGSWFIMKEDTENGSFRYIKGDSGFSNSWNKREKLGYDYYSNVF